MKKDEIFLELCPRKAPYDLMEINDCNLAYTEHNEAKNPFGYNISINDSSIYAEAFKYTSVHDDTLIFSTWPQTYTASGYIHQIRDITTKQMIKGFQYLQDHHWIDRYTRTVFLTFGLYNPNANLFIHCSLILEQLPTTAQFLLRSSFEPFKLVQLYTGVEVIYCTIYLILIIYYIIEEIKLILKLRQAYMKQFWSYINWTIFICSWFGVVIHFFRQRELKKMANLLKTTKGRTPINLQPFSHLDNVLVYLISFCCFSGTLKLYVKV